MDYSLPAQAAAQFLSLFSFATVACCTWLEARGRAEAVVPRNRVYVLRFQTRGVTTHRTGSFPGKEVYPWRA